MKKTFQLSFVLLAMMLLASCSGGGSDSGLSDNSAGTETVFVRMNARSNSDIASLSVEVRGSKATDDKPSALEYPSSICVQPSEYRVFRDINVSNDPISFCVLPDNDYVFHVKVFDVDHNLIYVYEGKKDITAGNRFLFQTRMKNGQTSLRPTSKQQPVTEKFLFHGIR